MKSRRFRGELGCEAGPLFVRVPFDVKEAFGRARAAVKVTVNDLEYRSTISVYGGQYYLPVRDERRRALGVAVGDVVDVTLAPDLEARTVEPPSDLAEALAKEARARTGWERLGYSRKKELADSLPAAKKRETRERRLAKILTDLRAGS